MPNEELLKILRQGVEAWNGWREENPEDRPDLRGAFLPGADISKVNVAGTYLDGANLTEAHLEGATSPKPISPELTSSAQR